MLQNQIYYTLAQVETGMLNWLVQQAPVIVVMGAVIYWLAKRLEKVEDEKSALAQSFVKLTTLFESKVDKNDVTDQKVIEKLEEIISLIKYGKNG